jgi:phosphomannomutase
MASAMRRHDALLGGGPSGRYWHSIGQVPLPDALATLTLVLVLLSRDDRPLSAVLDAEAATG